MANEKPKQGDKLPTLHKNEEPGYLYSNNVAADITGIFDDKLPALPHFPYGDNRGAPERPLPVTSMMNDISPRSLSHHSRMDHGYLCRPVLDYSCVKGNVNDFFQYHDNIKDLDAAANKLDAGTIYNHFEHSKTLNSVVTTTGKWPGDLQASKGHREGNTCGPWLIGNEGSCGHITTMSGNTNTMSNEVVMNNSVVGSDVQSDHSEILDGSFLSLGGNTKTQLSPNTCSRNRARQNILLHSDTSDREKTTKSSVNFHSNTAGGFPSFNDNAGGFGPLAQSEGRFSTVGQNVGVFSNLVQSVNEFPSLARNVDRFSQQEHSGFPLLGHNVGVVSQEVQNVNEVSRFSQKVDGFICQKQNEASTLGKNVSVISQHVQSVKEASSLVQNVGDFSSMAQNVDGFSCQEQNVNRCSSLLQGVGGVSRPSKSEIGGNLSQLLDKQQYRCVPSSWNIGTVENQNAEFAFIDPNTGIRGFPTMSSMPHVSNQYSMPNHGQRVMRDSLFIGSTDQPAFIQQNPHLGNIWNVSSEPLLPSPFAGVTNIPRQELSVCRPFLVNEGTAAHVTEGGLPFETFGIQPSSYLGQFQATVPVQPLQNLCTPLHTAGQEIRATSRPPQASSVALGNPSLKRGRTPSPATARAQYRKIRPTKIPSHPSSSNVAETAPLCAPLIQTSSSSSHLNPGATPFRPSSVHFTTPPNLRRPRVKKNHHIKWQDPDQTPKPSGWQCQICQRDLSFSPEGPVHQPVAPPPVAVLPCQHYFHSHCLDLITPEEQAHDPPCIPCAMGEKN